MTKILLLAFDLLDFPISDSVEKIGKILEENPQTRLISCWKSWFVFFAFQELLLGKISQDDFISLGDMFGNLQDYQINPAFDLWALIYALENDSKKFKDSLVLLPQDWKSSFDEHLDSLISILDENNIQIFYL